MKHPFDQSLVRIRSATPSASDLLIEKLAQRDIPFSVMIELTVKCNRCLHCYNYDRSTTMPASLKQEMTPDEVYRIIDEAVAEGCFHFTFTGGEALLNPHLLDFIKHARSHHSRVHLKTNGTLLNENNIQDYADAGVENIWVSLYGSNACHPRCVHRKTGLFRRDHSCQ